MNKNKNRTSELLYFTVHTFFLFSADVMLIIFMLKPDSEFIFQILLDSMFSKKHVVNLQMNLCPCPSVSPLVHRSLSLCLAARSPVGFSDMSISVNQVFWHLLRRLTHEVTEGCTIATGLRFIAN